MRMSHSASLTRQVTQPSRPCAGMTQAPIAVRATQLRSHQGQSATQSRRELMSLLAFVPVVLLTQTQPAHARAASEVCVDAKTEEEDAECRKKSLAKDSVNKEQELSVYNEVASRAPPSLAQRVPVSALGAEFLDETESLIGKLTLYLGLDMMDKARPPLVKSLKTDASSWVSKYARGGSARSQAARRMYIAVDSVVGHLASNGLAPLPAGKVKAVKKSLEEAQELLVKGI